jgi:ParB-like chromosome segregation protein Spo0J
MVSLAARQSKTAVPGAAPSLATSENRTSPVSADQIIQVPLGKIQPSPENDQLYGVIDPNDPDVRDLAEDVARRGVLDPLVLTPDYFIVSGHRRYTAARLAKLTVVPARFVAVRRTDPNFLQVLQAHNKQRLKTPEQRAREEIVAAADPETAYLDLLSFRRQRSRPADLGSLGIVLGERKKRSRISKAKRPMLQAAVAFIEQRRDFWPLSDRLIHYGMLNNPPLKHASKPDSRYVNDLKSYKNLCELLTRARLTGEIPMRAIEDETRAEVLVRAFPDVGAFVREESGLFLQHYCRDLQRSQPAHIEVLAEKLTVRSIVETVCDNYCLPLTIGRGFASLPPRYKMAERFRKSGKDRFTLIIVSDADPEGECIAESFARSMRDDFGITSINAVKAALTPAVARGLGLPTIMVAKTGSSRRKGFVERHGEQVWELEALPPERLQELLREAIESVLDRVRFEQEIAAEKADAATLANLRTNTLTYLATVPIHGRTQGQVVRE